MTEKIDKVSVLGMILAVLGVLIIAGFLGMFSYPG